MSSVLRLWVILAPLASMGAWAQEEILPTISLGPISPAGSERQAAVESRQIPEIVVTAQRSDQLIEDVPMSVTVLGGDFVRESAARDLADLTAYMPGVRVHAFDPGSPKLYIRGFGTNPFNPGFESSVGIVQDDIYLGRPGYFNEALFDIDRVEVLRGPQGTLFGKNTSAGVFSLTSRAPTEEWSSDGRVSYGEHNARRVEGGSGGMFADWGGVRLSGLYREEDGELFNQLLKRDEQALRQTAGRVHFVFLPGDGIKSQLIAQTSDTRAAYWPFQLFRLDADTHSYLQSFDPQVEDNVHDYRTSMDTPGFIERGSTTVGLNTRWDLDGPAGLTRLSPVMVLATSKFHIGQLDDLDTSPADIARLDSRDDHRQRSAELRLNGAAESLFGFGDSVEFVAGSFYYAARFDLVAHARAGADIASFLLTPDLLQLASGNRSIGLPGGVGVPGVPLLGDLGSAVIGDDYFRFDYAQRATSAALFGQLSWRLGDGWGLTAGLRLNRERKRAASAGHSGCPGTQAGLPRPCVFASLVGAQDYDQQNLRRSESDLSPRFALQYFFDNGVHAYAAYTRGSKSGGFNAISFTGEDLVFAREKARSVELGLKGRGLDGALQFSATIHRTAFDDLQVLAFNGVFFDVNNAASARSEGLEGDFQWLTPWPWLGVTGSLGVLDARYRDYSSAPAPVSQGIGEQQDLSGKRIAFAPRASASLSPALDFPFDSLALRLALDVLHQGSQFTDTDLDPATRVAAHTQFGMRASLRALDDRWTLTVGGTNLGDQQVLDQVVDTVFFPGTYAAQQARGRHLFVAVTGAF